VPVEKKKVALVCVLVAIAIGPMVLLSTWSLSKFEKYAVSHPDRPSSPGLLLKVAWIYRSSFRPEQSKEAYRSFYLIFKDHPDAMYAQWQYVLGVKETESRRNTGFALEEFVARWEGRPGYSAYEPETQKVFFFVRNL
jgi:hypothetical protein